MTITTLLLCGFILLASYSFFRIKNGRKGAELIYQWGFPLGVFVWEDSFIFSLLAIIACTVVLITGQPKYGLLFFTVYWVVRSVGETFYWMLQQFIVPKHAPHNIAHLFDPAKKILKNLTMQQLFILVQVIQQSITVLAIVSLILLLMNWWTL